MKLITLMVLFIIIPVLMASAQETDKKDSYPYWTISKDVQSIRYKNVPYAPSKIVLGDVRSSLTKDIHKSDNTQPLRKGNVIRSGYPTWTISKGVARQQAERSSR